jgi:TolB-like protein
LAEFASVVDAVNGAIKIQEEIKRTNADTPQGRRMEFRIGINLGDVIEEEDRIYGDGVNIAARVEGLAAGGGIAISGTVYEHIKEKLSLGYHYLGEQDVKNISEPVRVYRLLTEPTDAGKIIGEKKSKSNKLVWATSGTVALLILVVGTIVIWNYYSRPSFEPASVEKMAFPLPEKPSIAVLPFDNLSGDTEQEYFADGMTDDLITALSKISGIFVISRNSVFPFKDKPVKIQQVAKELNVHYVLEGSIRKAGDKIRVNAQLIDAYTDHHLWAEKYDGRIKDVFSLQDNITQKIVSALSVKLTNKEQLLLSTAETNNMQAYDLFLKARNLRFQHTPESFAEASKLLKKAVELDINYNQAYAELAYLYWVGATWGGQFLKALGVDYFSGRYQSLSYLKLAMQNPTPMSFQVAAYAARARRQFEKAAEEAQKAIELSPSGPEGYAALAFIYKDTQPEEAISYAKMQARLDPQSLPYSLFTQGMAHFFLKNYEKTVELMERAGVHVPNLLQSNAYLVAAYAYLGHDAEANRIYKNQFLKGFKGSRAPSPEHIIHVNSIQKPEMADLLINGLIKAGFPAQPDNYSRLSNDEKLSVEEVKEIVFGKTWTGYYWHRPSVQWWESFLKDGKYTYKERTYKAEREYGFEEDKLYVVREFKGGKIKTYPTIYRNPHGNFDQKNQYFCVTEVGAWSFSVQKNSQ